jgi:hypothetical protein
LQAKVEQQSSSAHDYDFHPEPGVMMAGPMHHPNMMGLEDMSSISMALQGNIPAPLRHTRTEGYSGRIIPGAYGSHPSTAGAEHGVYIPYRFSS